MRLNRSRPLRRPLTAEESQDYERARETAELSAALVDPELDRLVRTTMLSTASYDDAENLRRLAAWGLDFAKRALKQEGLVGRDAAPILTACRSAVLRAIERDALTVEADWGDVENIVRKARLVEWGLHYSRRELEDAGVEGAEADRIQAQCREALEHELIPQSSRPDAQSIVDRLLDDELGTPDGPDRDDQPDRDDDDRAIRDLVSSGMAYARGELRKAGVTGARFFKIQSEVQQALEQELTEDDGQDDAFDIADNVLDQHLGPAD